MSGCPYAHALDPNVNVGGLPNADFKELREAGPLHYVEDEISGVPYWLVTQQEEMDFISKNPKLFSSEKRSALPMEPESQEVVDNIMSRMFLNMDPPRQLQYRRLVRNTFTPKKVAALEPHFRQQAREIVNSVIEKGECEFVEDVAAELPLMTILELFDIPLEDRSKFFEWTNIMFFADDPDTHTAPEEGMLASLMVIGYAQEMYKKHHESPQDNIVGALLSAEIDGEPMSEEDFCWIVLMMIVAGNESTRTAIAHGMRQLIEHPDQLQFLQENPDKIDNAIEEMLRCNPSFSCMRRTALEDVELSGQTIKAGDKVVLHYHIANYQKEVFGDDAEEFDVRRMERFPSLPRESRAFGVGQHFCLGAHLARLELQVMFDEIIPRMKNPTFSEPVSYMRSYFVQGIKKMNIRFDKGEKQA